MNSKNNLDLSRASGLLYEKVEFFTAVGIAALVANAAAGFGKCFKLIELLSLYFIVLLLPIILNSITLTNSRSKKLLQVYVDKNSLQRLKF